MISFNGWIMIRASFRSEEEEDDLLNSIIQQIESEITQMEYTNECYSLNCLNGNYYLSIMVSHNHRSEHVIDFFKWVAKIAVGSYGLLYVQDDEDIERKNDNKFKVFCMKKGVVSEEDDTFLSPFFYEIEE